jgi:hypothetical protein
MHWLHIISYAPELDVGTLPVYPIYYGGRQPTDLLDGRIVQGAEGGEEEEEEECPFRLRRRGEVGDGYISRRNTTAQSEIKIGSSETGEEGRNETVVQYENGVSRRYSTGGGSCERLGNTDIGRIHKDKGVGLYRIKLRDTSSRLQSPWKLVAVHYGTNKPHWHIIYISTARQWHSFSNLGKSIRKYPYKVSRVSCLACLRKYIYNGNGRQILLDICTGENLYACKCAFHSFNLASNSEWNQKELEDECSSRGNLASDEQSTTSSMGNDNLGNATVEADNIETAEGGGYVQPEQNMPTRHKRENNEKSGQPYYRRGTKSLYNDSGLVFLFTEKGIFNEGDAAEILSRSAEGISFLLHPRTFDRIRGATYIARILVFQENIRKRFKKAKAKALEECKEADDKTNIETAVRNIEHFLSLNNVNIQYFAETTYKHLTGQLKKKNNLFFVGPPSTGKTMLMDSLVKCNFNYTRLTGLVPGSSFNFSNLLHCNACFMDECKLTDNQFEQWKLLAGRSPMSTDVKYREKHYVKDCTLYTASNYPIDMYCTVPDSKQAIQSRTTEFVFLKTLNERFDVTPFAWEEFWKKYGFEM